MYINGYGSHFERIYELGVCKTQGVLPHPILPQVPLPLFDEEYSKPSKILSFMLNLYKSKIFLDILVNVYYNQSNLCPLLD